MPRRNLVFSNQQVYHIYNRSIAGEEIFTDKYKLKQITRLLDYYKYLPEIRYSKYRTQNKEIRKELLEKIKKRGVAVSVFAYCFMPDHFHLLVRQEQSGGLTKFVSNIQNSYAHYFNIKFQRHGGLFQSPFKAKIISSDELLLHVSRYIHLNPVSSHIIRLDRLSSYPFTSYPIYVSGKGEGGVETKVILKIIGSRKKYIKFVKNNADYQKSLKRIRRLVTAK